MFLCKVLMNHFSYSLLLSMYCISSMIVNPDIRSPNVSNAEPHIHLWMANMNRSVSEKSSPSVWQMEMDPSSQVSRTAICLRNMCIQGKECYLLHKQLRGVRILMKRKRTQSINLFFPVRFDGTIGFKRRNYLVIRGSFKSPAPIWASSKFPRYLQKSAWFIAYMSRSLIPRHGDRNDFCRAWIRYLSSQAILDFKVVSFSTM